MELFNLKQMNYLSALIICKVSKTPIKISELRIIQKNGKELASFLRVIVELNKDEVKYDRKKLTDYYLNGGNIENVSRDLVIARKVGQFLALSEAIETDKKGIDFIKYFENKLKTGHNKL